jgi:hypothetical protein
MKRLVINGITAKGEMTATEYKRKYGNAMYSLNVNGEVLVKDCVFGMNGYNCIEISLSESVEPVSKVTIENCDFSGSLNNNAILVFDTKPGTIITVRNCHFASVSNVIRLSNRSGAKNVVLNIEDCTIDKWDSDPKYAGFLILEDYKSKNMDTFNELNPFGPDKITVNVKNMRYAGNKICPDQVDAYLNCNDPKQLAYVYIDNVGSDYRYPAYDPAIFPVFNFR